MSGPIRGAESPNHPAPGAAAQNAKLRKASHDLEGVFVNELFKAMRDTVPEDGILSQDSGQEMFTSLMDTRLSETYAEKSQSGLGEALYHQLSRRLPDHGAAPGAP
jgi:flagellar protein FlgJ